MTGTARVGSAGEVLGAFARLGCTSFGGPIAHLGYFRAEFVTRRGWLAEADYADIVALCQFLPGPASSQVAVSLGLLRAGLPGGLAAWLGFSAPSALALVLFAYGVSRVAELAQAGWVHGLKIVAVAVVAQAVWGMARTLCPDRERASLAVGAALLALAVPSAAGQIAAIGIGGLIGWRLLPRPEATARVGRIGFALPRGVGPAALALFFLLLAALPACGGGERPACGGTGRSVLPRRGARVRRRACRAAAAAARGGAAGLDLADRVPRRLWRRAGGAGAAVHLRRLPGRGDAAGAERLAGRRSCVSARSTCRPSCCCSACCRSGTGCAAPPRCRRRCAG